SADAYSTSLSAANLRYRCRGLRSHVQGSFGLRHSGCGRFDFATKNFGDLRIPLAADFNCVPNAHHAEELLDVPIVHANAAVRSCSANRVWRIRAVDAVASLVEADPARAHRIVIARWNNHSGVVVSGVGDSVDDLKLASGTLAHSRAHGNGENLQHGAVLDERQLAVGNADQHLPLWARRHRRDC